MKRNTRNRRENTRRGAQRDSDSESEDSDFESVDGQSVTSFDTESITSPGEPKVLAYHTTFLEQFENLTEKRGSTRQAAIAEIHKILAHHYAGELLENKTETLIETALNGIKKGGEEALLSVKILQVLIITVIEEISDEYLHSVPNTLDNLSKSQDLVLASSGVEVAYFWRYMRKAIREPWSDQEIEALMSELWQLVLSRCPTCVKVWGLLATLLSPRSRAKYLVDEAKITVVKKLLRLLDHESPEVRTAVGETIALLYEARDIDMENRSSYTDEDDEQAEERSYELTDDILVKLQQLSTESSKKKSKKERKMDRASFRDILATVEEGSGVKEKLTINKQDVEFHGWERVLLFNYFKDLMGHGVVDHLQHNPVMRDHIFAQELEYIDFSQKLVKLSSLEKRLYLGDTSEASKQRTKAKSKQSRNAVIGRLPDEN